MFDLCSDTESAKTIKALRDVVDSLRARLRTGGLRSQHAASDVQALQKQISILESEVNGLHDDLAAPSKLHIKVKGMLTLGVRDALAGQVVQNGEGGGEEGGGEHASVSTEVPVQDQTRPKRIRYKPASKDIK
jgi:hypothetical protein